MSPDRRARSWKVYLSGEIHSDWRERIESGIEEAGLPVSFSAPVTDHGASDDAGVGTLGEEGEPFWRDHMGAGVNAIRTQTLIREADVVVVRFGDKYRQWNAAFDAGYAAALAKPIVTLHDSELDHALKEVEPCRPGHRPDRGAGGRRASLRDRRRAAARLSSDCRPNLVRTYVRMRWDEQRVERDMRLPGIGDGSVVRTFDAPEAMGINFHEVKAKSALNHVSGGSFGFSYTVNQYRGCTHACKFCFARPTHTYLGFDAGRDFEREIVVKVNVPEVLRAELAKPTWKRELVALGTNTDPYQWVESRYRMMPEILAALEEAETPVSVLTKSPLALRDIEIFERMAKAGLPVSVNLSVPTLDEKAWRATEPHTPSPSARLDAVAELRRRGIDSGVLIAPLMPGINDSPGQVQPIVDRAREAGATFLGGVALHLRGEVRDVFFGWLEAKRPDLLPKYEQLYSNDRAYLRPEQRARVTRAVRGWGRGRGSRLRPGELQAGRGRPERREAGAMAAPVAPAPTQSSLF